MPDEATCKKIALEYHERMNAGDADAVMELFADDIIFEDPVGVTPIAGLAAVRQHIVWSIAFKVHESPGRPVAAMDGRHVALPVIVTIGDPVRLTFHIIGVLQVGEDGLIHRAQGFWGMTDTRLGDGSKPTGATEFLAVAEQLNQISMERFGAAGPTVAGLGRL
jgi:steroid delta-isomerase